MNDVIDLTGDAVDERTTEALFLSLESPPVEIGSKPTHVKEEKRDSFGQAPSDLLVKAVKAEAIAQAAAFAYGGGGGGGGGGGADSLFHKSESGQKGERGASDNRAVMWRGFALDTPPPFSDDLKAEWAARDPLREIKQQGIDPRFYQGETAIAAAENDRFLIHHPMGSGKTLTGMLTAELALKASYVASRPFRVVVVGPVGLLVHHFRQLQKLGRSYAHIRKYYAFYSFGAALHNPESFLALCRGNCVIIDEVHDINTVITFKNTPPKRGSPPVVAAAAAAAATDDDGDIRMADSDSVSSPSSEGEEEEEEEKPKKKTKKPRKPRKPRPYIRWQGQYVHQGKRAAAVVLGVQHARQVVCMTGTLFTNYLSDIVNIATIMAKGPTSETCRMLNAKRLKTQESFSTDGALLRYLDTLFQGKVSFLRREDVPEGMPSTLETAVLLEMAADYYEQYLKIEQSQFEVSPFNLEGIEYLQEAGPFWNGLRQLVDEQIGFDSQKRLFILNLLRSHTPEKPTWPMIISTTYIGRGIQPLKVDLKAAGFSFVEISGERKLADRQQARDDYNKGKVQVILLTAAGSTGIDLHGTRTHVTVESKWNTAREDQAKMRGVRIGSGTHVNIYRLFLAKPAELDLFADLMQKHIQERAPGASDAVLKVRVPPQANPPKARAAQTSPPKASASSSASASGSSSPSMKDEEKEEKKNELAGIDLVLYALQIKKAARCTRALLKHVARWSIYAHLHEGLRMEAPPSPPASNRRKKRRAPRSIDDYDYEERELEDINQPQIKAKSSSKEEKSLSKEEKKMAPPPAKRQRTENDDGGGASRELQPVSVPKRTVPSPPLPSPPPPRELKMPPIPQFNHRDRGWVQTKLSGTVMSRLKDKLAAFARRVKF